MGIEKTISTENLKISAEDLKDKLAHLASHIPGETPKVYEVAQYLASRLGDGDLSPRGFVSAFELMFIDMQRGVDGYTNEPLPENLRDQLGIAYSTAYRKVPLIANAICPEEFAKSVVQEASEVFGR